MATSTLSGPQRRHLKSLAHPLVPIVLLGKEGLSEAVCKAAAVALRDHELIKVKLPQVDKAERQSLAQQLAEGTESALVQSIGRVVVLYRPHPEKPRIRLPR